MMDSNDDLTIDARTRKWEIFAPDWGYLRQYPALQLVSLCALSVGLHPAFASPGWVFNLAMPHFSGTDPDEFCPLEDAAEGAKRAARLDDFLRRVNIAVGNLVPRGTLPIADGAADGERTVVRVADFVVWANGLGWAMPEEMKRMGPYPEAEEGLQDGGKPLTARAETTYLNIIAALLDCIAGNLPNVEKHPSFASEAKLIEAIEQHYKGYSGLSQSNLSRKFPEAKRSLQAQ